jgi:hypothetical protein
LGLESWFSLGLESWFRVRKYIAKHAGL